MEDREKLRQQLKSRLERAIRDLPDKLVEKYAAGQFLNFRCHMNVAAPAVTWMQAHKRTELKRLASEAVPSISPEFIKAYFEEGKEITIHLQRDKPVATVLGEAPKPMWGPWR